MSDLSDLDVSEVTSGVRLRLRVTPGARREGVTGVHGGALRVSVAAAPEKGAANRALQSLLAGVLGVPKAAVRIERGTASRDKVVVVEGVAASFLRGALAAAARLSGAGGSRARTRA